MKYKDFTYKELSEEIYDNIMEYLEMKGLTGSLTNNFEQTTKKLDFEVMKVLLRLKDSLLDFEKFYKNYKVQILKDQKFTDSGYFMDYLLYKFDNKYPIGGVLLTDLREDELVIKYQYGYYKYDLGEKVILQSFDTLGDYFYYVAQNFILTLLLSEEIKHVELQYYTNISEADVRKVQDLCSIINKGNDFTSMIIHIGIFVDILGLFIENKNPELIYTNIVNWLGIDLKSLNIYNYYDKSYLILLFGRDYGKIRIEKKDILTIENREQEITEFIEQKEMEFAAKRYNL